MPEDEVVMDVAIGRRVQLPAVAPRSTVIGCAIIHYVVRGPREATINQLEDVQVSPRRRAACATLDDGERVVLTDRKSESLPANAVGVLRLGSDGINDWIQHQLADEAQTTLESTPAALRDAAVGSWNGQVRLVAERRTQQGREVLPGLRPPQLAALYAIGAHWTLHTDPATVVMPTGTGKTETMLGALVSHVGGKLVVAVPSRPLIAQTVRKLVTLGLLQSLGILPASALYPVVGVLRRRPQSTEDLGFMSMCNVVVGTVSALAQGTAVPLLPDIAARATHLVLDEAHHAPAATWTQLREAFDGKPVLQFTATPFRSDGKEVDGRVIFNYPLARAQDDGYFTPIHFVGVAPGQHADADERIAARAVAQLDADVADDLDHIVMARCATIERAERIAKLYARLAPHHGPILVHSDMPRRQADDALASLRRREARIVACVDMLGEGFDFPQLKIAALHDVHKSLAVLLQFTGRFTRTAGDRLGEATVVANTDDPSVPAALEQLYSEDADWNRLLADYSFEEVRRHQELLEFLRSSVRLDEYDPEEPVPLKTSIFRPLYSALVYECDAWNPREFHHAVAASASVRGAWLNDAHRMLYFVSMSQPGVRWARSSKVRDVQWDIYVLHHDETHRLLFLHSSNKDSLHQDLAGAVGSPSARLLRGEAIFRVLGRINRLMFQNVGVTSHGRRKLRYSMYSGSDVAEALSPQQLARTTRSNIFGAGYEGGSRVSVGCSRKGRVWCREVGPLLGFATWCDAQAAKLRDSSISTDKIIEDVLIPQEIDTLPDKIPLSIEWPEEWVIKPEHRVEFSSEAGVSSLAEWSIELGEYDRGSNQVGFRLVHAAAQSAYILRLDTEVGYRVQRIEGAALQLARSATSQCLEDFFSDCPPLVLFVDGAELDGCHLVEPKTWDPPPIPTDRLRARSWTGIDITKESMWKDGAMREDSVQHAVAQELLSDGAYDVVFDDDGPGEAADIVCLASLAMRSKPATSPGVVHGPRSEVTGS